MQGVVGMLDVMHATVREAMESKSPVKSGGVFQSLKEGIEMVQDSARRAVEAADNVVHAYELNMQIPKTPLREEPEVLGGLTIPSTIPESRPNIFIEGKNIAVNPYKRRRSLPPEINTRPVRKQRLRAASSRHVRGCHALAQRSNRASGRASPVDDAGDGAFGPPAAGGFTPVSGGAS